ncbi:uridine diphosphate-N-acetylglucosamine-binding protein YvcK [Ferrimonas sp. YFM]|uniref:gluconeogenesis factor YvcK family protein n=1 Tax=Ferrimonas sp. YFM TaxID=3028878 RepID=UPI0025730755|nr:uridine diphosphate-N-acetylglucosamine-binding protein YvcK [Ferrimonas sp. YFM]BDY04936.1 putative gluconeogenesis factor [Ferrimonas sp. YFM]
MNVVAMGGGHGLSRVLQALSPYPMNLSAIIATTDNGGSTGRLRENFGGIAFGDIRNCLSSLVSADHLGRLLLDFRFDEQSELNGHNLGNLMLQALDSLCVRPSDAVELLCRLLEVPHALIPMAELPTQLKAGYQDGSIRVGEVEIDGAAMLPNELSLYPRVPACDEALEQLKRADMVVIGPGSIITSLAPPLLVPEIRQALLQRQVPLVMIANLAPEHGAVGECAPEQQRELLHTLTGIKVDLLLCNGESDDQDSHTQYRPLAPLDSPYHSPVLLGQALHEIIQADSNPSR